MDIKNLIASLVFLLIWRITMSQQVTETKDPRIKIYHENHIDDMKKQSSLTNQQNGRIKKYIELKPPTLGPVNFINKNVNPEKRKQSKIFRIKPMVPNQHKPFMFAARNRDDLNLNIDGLTKANVTKSELKKEDVTIVSKDASEVSTNESSPVKVTDLQLGNKLINTFSTIIPYHITNPSKPAFSIDVPTTQNLFTTKSQTTKPLVTELKLHSKEQPNTEIKHDNIQIDTANITHEAIHNKTEYTNSGPAKINLIDNDDVKEKHKKHPFLDAIQNDRYLMCSPQDAPNASVIADTTSIEDIEIQFRDGRLSARPKPTPNKVLDMNIPHIDTKDEIDDVTIKSCTLEEILEISDIPLVTLDPEFNANNIPVPYMYNQVLKSMDLHNQLDLPTPDEQRIVKKDEKNVYIYNNYYQTPTGYWYGYNHQRPYKQHYHDNHPDLIYYQPTTAYNTNYGNHASRATPGIQNYWNKVYNTNSDVNRNINAYYGYNSAQPQQLQKYWYRDYDTTRGINKRIYQKWMNTELSIKGKNAFKQISDDNLRNRFIQSGPIAECRGLNLISNYR